MKYKFVHYKKPFNVSKIPPPFPRKKSKIREWIMREYEWLKFHKAVGKIIGEDSKLVNDYNSSDFYKSEDDPRFNWSYTVK